jgi:hypothetical protein
VLQGYECGPPTACSSSHKHYPTGTGHREARQWCGGRSEYSMCACRVGEDSPQSARKAELEGSQGGASSGGPCCSGSHSCSQICDPVPTCPLDFVGVFSHLFPIPMMASLHLLSHASFQVLLPPYILLVRPSLATPPLTFSHVTHALPKACTFAL